jgi:hypothetical protein
VSRYSTQGGLSSRAICRIGALPERERCAPFDELVTRADRKTDGDDINAGCVCF